MKNIFNHAKYKISSLDKSQFPVSDAEICFIGRSNVGKSTFLNALVGSKVSFSSKKPGKTVTINFFQLQKCNKYLVDLPGYGFAKVPPQLKQQWQDKITSYLRKRKSLKMICFLLDSKAGMTAIDLENLQTLEEEGLPIALVFNKYDNLRGDSKKSFDKKIAAMVNDIAANSSSEIRVYKISSKKKEIGEFEKLKKDLITIIMSK